MEYNCQHSMQDHYTEDGVLHCSECEAQETWDYWPTHWAGGWGEHALEPNRIRIGSSRGGTVAYIEHHGTGSVQQDIYPTPEDYEHARLVAAAPELLEACKALLEDKGANPSFGVLDKTQAAIAKAEPTTKQPCCSPGWHEIIPESGNLVHCTKCQRSGRRVDGMIRWSD
jgi:hypothetical protein